MTNNAPQSSQESPEARYADKSQESRRELLHRKMSKNSSSNKLLAEDQIARRKYIAAHNQLHVDSSRERLLAFNPSTADYST